MMPVRISIYDDDTRYTVWWRNFIGSMHISPSNTAPFNNALCEYNGRDVYGTEYIEFDKADATAFILRWS